MTKNELIDQYFDWMYQLVVDNRYSKSYFRGKRNTMQVA